MSISTPRRGIGAGAPVRDGSPATSLRSASAKSRPQVFSIVTDADQRPAFSPSRTSTCSADHDSPPVR